ncbi:serine hydrolase domain-containing protein [Paenibacillus sp.]|uniref:serine hydrolase domain-containing protein n=1 Tax=Paenibacillus sp. TaxID=58172 RepID=UPI00283080B0|nr:serine hydrolase domain-containing protein [Paenibacillus sp.]MDR0266528.1 beta-lactamase family protein [Paenibacillus sp.]
MKGIEKVHQLLESWVADKKIPGAVVDIRVGNQMKWQSAYGTATLDTIFDVASLTKVAVTLPGIMMLVESSKLSLQDPVQKYIPEFRHAEVTIEHCLKHISGLPAGIPDFEKRHSIVDAKQQIFEMGLEAAPGERVNYSDLGFILLGWIISRLTDQSLDEFAKETIYTPIGMKDSCFNPSQDLHHRIAPTEWDGSKYILGEVHDETSYRLGGVAGSAGLFTTAEDLSKYAQVWLYPEQYSLLTKETMEACRTSVFDGRGLGWQVQGSPGVTLSCGPHWPVGSFGHTGYTGTSLWINPVDKVSVVFLTNAVHYGRDSLNVFRELRPILHEAVIAANL